MRKQSIHHKNVKHVQKTSIAHIELFLKNVTKRLVTARGIRKVTLLGSNLASVTDFSDSNLEAIKFWRL